MNYDAFDDGTIDNKASSQKLLERAKIIIITSILLSNTHSQQSLALHSALTSR